MPSSALGGSGASAAANVAFGVALADHMAASRRSNLLFSPRGLQQLLALLSLGARGETQTQIMRVLSQLSVKPGSPEAIRFLRSLAQASGPGIVLNNAIWLDERYRPSASFKAQARDIFSAPVFRANLSSALARRQIESWLQRVTLGRINDVPIPRNASFAAINALCYTGAWREPFDVKQTTARNFYGYRTVRTQMMYSERNVAYYEAGKVQYIALPFADGREMFVVLPTRSAAVNLAQALAFLGHRSLLKRAFVRISLPRFEFRDHIDLVDTLKRLGMPNAFSSEADFTNLFGAAHVPLTYAYQEGWVRVNERGAQTAVASVAGAAFGPSKIIEFRADHPFAFAIDDPRDGAVLAAGIVDRP